MPQRLTNRCAGCLWRFAIQALTRLSAPPLCGSLRFSVASVLGLSEFNTEDSEKSHRGHRVLTGEGEEWTTGKESLTSLNYSPSTCLERAKHFWLWVRRVVISCAAYPTQALEPRNGHAKLFLEQP